MEAAHYPNANIEKVRHSLPSLRASRYSGNRKGVPCPRVAIFRDRVSRGYGPAEHTRVTVLGALSLHSLSTPIFIGAHEGQEVRIKSFEQYFLPSYSSCYYV